MPSDQRERGDGQRAGRRGAGASERRSPWPPARRLPSRPWPSAGPPWRRAACERLARTAPRVANRSAGTGGQRLPDRLVHALRHARPHRPHARRRLGEPLRDDRLRRGAGVRRLARQHLVEHRAEAVDVGPGVEPRVAGGLLRAHVGRRADREPGLGQPRLRRAAAQRPGDPEVGHQRIAVPGEQEVLRLDVAVDHAVSWAYSSACAASRAIRSASSTGSCRSRRSRSRRLSPSTNGMVNQSWPVGLAGVVDREDVGMLEPGGEPDLALEALGAERGGELGMEHLERDRAVVPEVLGEVDRGHAPAAELALERVAVPQRFTKCRDRIRHQPRFFGGTLAKDTTRARDGEGVGRWQ